MQAVNTVNPAAPKRPALIYHGGKWRLAPWIISFFPEHRIYVEPFGGAASVLLQKHRSLQEVYNDLDKDVVAFFDVLRDEDQAAELVRQLRLTPFARAEFERSYENADTPIEQARRLVIRSFMGVGSKGHVQGYRTGFRSFSKVNLPGPSTNWIAVPDNLMAISARLQGVCIEKEPAIDLIRKTDSPSTLFYLDPPYVHETRNSRWNNAYRHEMADSDHEELASVVHQVKGFVIISGYPGDLYERLYADWQSVERDHLAMRNRRRIEKLWLSPNCRQQLPLFAEGDL